MGLSCVVEAGDPQLATEVARQGAVDVWRQLRAGALDTALAERAARIDLDVFARQLDRGRFRFVIPGDQEWPAGLDDLQFCDPVQRRAGPPFGLWLRGPARMDASTARSVAIVGSRASSAYGDTVAGDLALELVQRGVCVISGGAFGIDAAAHRGALAGPLGSNGSGAAPSPAAATVAVLACGVDVSYPPGNQQLFAQLAQEQLLVSELPPGAHPTRLRFLARNRLIAAMTSGTVVVEAAARSGARNTATWARECNRPLMAVPGPVYSALSAAPHAMIREQQATLVTSADDVVEMISAIGAVEASSLFGPVAGSSVGTAAGAVAPRPTDCLEPIALAVFEALPASRVRPVGEIALTAGVGVSRCLAELDALEELGLAEGTERGWRICRTGAGPAR